APVGVSSPPKIRTATPFYSTTWPRAELGEGTAGRTGTGRIGSRLAHSVRVGWVSRRSRRNPPCHSRFGGLRCADPLYSMVRLTGQLARLADQFGRLGQPTE